MSIEAHRWLMTASKRRSSARRSTPSRAPARSWSPIAGCGVCHTDLGYYYDGVRTNQPLPLALGHEISGRVVAAGAGAEALARQGGHRSGRAAVRRMRPLPARPRADLPQPEDAGQRHPGRLRHRTSSCRAAGCARSTRRASREPGLTLADVSIVADALTTPYQAVRRAGVAPGSARHRRRRRRRRRLLRADRARVRREGRRDRRRRRQARRRSRSTARR